MQLLTLGVNHHTAPLAIREQVAFGPEKLVQALHELTQSQRATEVAILSTCNRMEIYACTMNKSYDSGIIEFMGECGGVTLSDLAPYIYTSSGHKAAEHLFRVAAGIDSMVLGETQIVGQIKEASDTINTASKEIAVGNSDLSQRTDRFLAAHSSRNR